MKRLLSAFFLSAVCFASPGFQNNTLGLQCSNGQSPGWANGYFSVCATGGGGGGSGTVSSVALTAPGWLSVTGSPVTSSGTLAVVAAGGQTANQFLATPNGSAGAVSVRAIVAADLPNLPVSQITGAAATAGASFSGSVKYGNCHLDPTPGTATCSSTATLDLSTHSAWIVSLTGACTISVTNPEPGCAYQFEFDQDATGGRALTLPATFSFAGTAPTFSTAASKADVVTAVYNSTATKYRATATVGY